MSGITYFLSDMHVIEQRPDITAALLLFLQGPALEADAVYLLGDVFDYWIGDDYETDTIRQVKQAFGRLTQQGVALFFVGGNRDFLVGRRFDKQTGCHLLPEHTVINLYQEPVLIMHGDTLCTLDVAYQKFRRTSRSWWWQLFMLNLPLKTRIGFVMKLKQRSKSEKSLKSDQIMDVTPDEVALQMSKYKVNTLIHGHTHRQNIHEFDLNGQPAKRIVLGDWYQSGCVLKCTPNQSPEFIQLPL